jgi:hypothetical protein
MTENRIPHTAEEAIQNLAAVYGPERTKAAAEALLGKLQARPEIPAEVYRVLGPQLLADTVAQLDASVDDILNKGQAREAAYGNKADLFRRRSELETKIKLDEAGALMFNVSPDGKKGEFNGASFPLNNGEQRDAFTKIVSAESRKELAKLDGDIQALEVEAMKARDGWEMAVQASESVRAKAFVQARLLQFLAGGQ